MSPDQSDEAAEEKGATADSNIVDSEIGGSSDDLNTTSNDEETGGEVSNEGTTTRGGSSYAFPSSSANEESDENDDNDDEADQLGPMVSEVRQSAAKARPSPIKQGSFKGERISNVHDLETGRDGGHRGHQALLRSQQSMRPQSAEERRRRNIFKNLGASALFYASKSSDDEEDGDANNLSMHGRLKVQEKNEQHDVECGRQYHLEAVHPHLRTRSQVANWLGMGQGGFATEDRNGGICCGFTPNQLVMNYLRWSFRSSFAAVFLSAALSFLGFTMLFAFLIWRIGHRHPQCIGGVDFENDYFMDAFALSWTTFSTVGYGLIYSGISADKPDIKECTGITILVTIEAFFGVLFASFCGAIVFGKINRIQSFAQVTFSDPIVIRYGTGVQVEDSHDTEDEGAEGGFGRGFPCPVLEFRIVNRLNGTIGGEILDATVNIVASIDVTQAQANGSRSMMHRRRGKKGKKKGPRRSPPELRQRVPSNRSSEEFKEDESKKSGSDDTSVPPRRPEFTLRRSLRGMNANKTLPLVANQSFDEDPSGYLVPKKIFSKLEVESPDHPFFKRVWIVRHRLDQNSPLLTPQARQLVKSNFGKWPSSINSPEGVRSAVKFDQILVSLSGTSNADANSVYAQKVYEYVDINVGYRFVNLLYRDPVDETLRADIRLINDVVEQAGGGGESFEAVDRQFGGSMSNMLVL